MWLAHFELMRGFYASLKLLLSTTFWLMDETFIPQLRSMLIWCFCLDCFCLGKRLVYFLHGLGNNLTKLHWLFSPPFFSSPWEVQLVAVCSQVQLRDQPCSRG